MTARGVNTDPFVAYGLPDWVAGSFPSWELGSERPNLGSSLGHYCVRYCNWTLTGGSLANSYRNNVRHCPALPLDSVFAPVGTAEGAYSASSYIMITCGVIDLPTLLQAGPNERNTH